MTECLLKTEDLAKDYLLGGEVVHALRGVSVEVAPGDFVAVMGPSGSGKSTFMNLLGCLDTPSSGTYVLDGMNVSHLTSDELARIRNQKLGFVFQNFNLLPRTSALENVELPLRYSHQKRVERRSQAEEALAAVGLKDRLHHHPSQLSGGQQQRVAIARALVNRPVLVLADEPTGALDSQTSVELMQLFQRLNGQGMTIVLVTHEPDVACFARRLLRFRDGQLVQSGPVAGLDAGTPGRISPATEDQTL
ncbi:MAG: ABC transporter ATP-binding protein [Hyphomicrobiales bacterium]